MEKKIKIFGLSVEFGDSIPNFEKIDQLIVQAGKHIVTAKKNFIAFSKILTSIDGSAQILEFMKEFEVRTKNTSVTRRKLTAEEKAANKIARESARAEEMQALSMQRRQGSIKQLEAEIAKLRITYENLSRAERQTAQGQAMKTHLSGLRKEMRQLRMETGDFSNNIGNYMSGLFNKASIAFAGVMGSIGTFKRFLYGLYGPFQDLEYRMAMVKAVSRATDEEFVLLQGNARKLGAETEYTATEVAGLQLAYARLGFVPRQIIEITGATLDLATATGENLERSSDVVGTTLKGFRLQADQTKRVVDVMTQSFNSSSLRLDFFADSMKYVAPLAVKANVSLEQTTAMLGVLADRGIRGSQAGTALRRIFLEIAKDGGSVSERLDELSKKGLSLGGAMDEVGKYAMTALSVLVDSKKDVDGLSTSLENADGAARKAAEGIRDTSKIGFDVLLSAVQEKLIALGQWLSPFVQKTTQFLTWAVTNIKTIILLIGGYVGIVKTLTLAKKAYYAIVQLTYGSSIAFGRALLVEIGQMKSVTAATKVLTSAKLLYAASVDKAKQAIIGFGRALIANPWGMVTMALAGIVSLFLALRNRTDEATAAQTRLNDETERFNRAQDEKRQRTEQLIRTIQDETETEFAKIRAYEELQRLSPTLTNIYTQEQIAALKLAESTKILNEQRDKEQYENLVSKVDKLTASLKRLREENGKIIGMSPTIGGGAIYVDYSRQIKKTETELEVYKKALEDAIKARNKAAEELRPIKLRIIEAEENVTQIEAALTEAERIFKLKRDEWISEHGTDLFMPFEFRFDVLSLEKQLTEARKILSDLKKGNNSTQTGNESAEIGKWSLSNDHEHNAALLKLKQQLYAGAIASEEEYQRKVLELEIDTLTKRIALNKEKGNDLLKLKQQLEDKQYKLSQNQQKAEEKYEENRRQSAQTLAEYEIANEEARINTMREGIDKKLALNELSAKKSEQAAEKEYREIIRRLEKEQEAYIKGSDQYEAIEQEKKQFKKRYEDQMVDILRLSVNQQISILRGATAEELRTLAEVGQRAAQVRQAINNLTSDYRKTTSQAVEKAENEYYVEMSLADKLYAKGAQRHKAQFDAEVKLRQDKSNAYVSEMRNLAYLGQADSKRFHECLSYVGQLQTEITNLGKGLNADGTGGGFGSFLKNLLIGGNSTIIQIRSAALDVARSISDSVAQIKIEASQRELSITKARIQEEYDAEVSKLEDKRKRGVISEKKYQKEMAKLEKEKEKKDKEAEKKAFEEQKRITIIQAAINTALSITNALATVKPLVPAGIIAAATAAATGAAQIAVISSQKFYRSGGVIDPVTEKMGILRGPSHGHGGMPIYIGNQYVGEAEGDELFAIVNKRDTQTLGALSALNARHGKKYAQGGTFTRSGVSAPVDYISSTTDYVSQSQLVKSYTDMMKFVQKQTDAINRRIDRIKVYVVQSEVAAANEEAEKLKAQTTF